MFASWRLITERVLISISAVTFFPQFLFSSSVYIKLGSNQAAQLSIFSVCTSSADLFKNTLLRESKKEIVKMLSTLCNSNPEPFDYEA